ncbi:Alpha/Beta hydrolase protein [Mycena epipterygia]|nr:Alpha/Beta hydrolase protein [Mycena epipterygia]
MSFPYRNQPWTTLYTSYSVVSILFLRLPFWIVVSALPSLRPRRSWSMGRTIVVHALPAVVAAMYEVGFSPAKHPEAYDSQPGFVWVDGIPPDMVRPSGETGSDGRYGQPAADGERVLYILHGGGHVSGSANPKLDSVPVTVPILDKAGGLISRAFAADKSVSGPANLLDVVAGYQYLVKDVGFEPKNIIVAGISSGGHLALDLVLYLAQANFPALALPAGLLLMSPTLDWARTHDTSPSCSMIRNRPADIVDPILRNGYTARALLGALPKSELATNPYLSPASLALPDPRGLFAGFPRTCITAGDAEQTLDPMRTL